MKKFFSFIFIALFAMCVCANAAVLSLLPEAVTLNDLAPGDTYSLGGEGGIVWKLSYHGRDPVRIVFSSVRPDHDLRGHKPIPEAGWLAPEQSVFETVQPGGSAATSVILNLPEDTSLSGKTFGVILEARAFDPETGDDLKLADHSEVFINFKDNGNAQVEDMKPRPEKASRAESVAKAGHADEATEKTGAGRKVTAGESTKTNAKIQDAPHSDDDADHLRLHPYIIDAGIVKRGLLAESETPLELINIGDTDMIVRIEQMSLADSGLEDNAPGHKSLPGGSFLVFTDRDIEVKAGWSVDVPFYVGIPDIDELFPGSYAIVIEAYDPANPRDNAESIVKFILK